MTGPEHEIPAEGGRGRLRASHADRERVIDTLKAAYVYGLVTKEEFDARVVQTFTARTHAELAAITADIPAGLLPAPAPLRPVIPKRRVNGRLGERAVVATATLAGLLFFVAFVAGGSMLPALWAGAVGSALVSLCLAGARMSNAQHDPRAGAQLPGQRGVHGGSRAGGRAESAEPAQQFPYQGKPQRPGSAEAAGRHSLRPQVSS
jgi:hypothetical protein